MKKVDCILLVDDDEASNFLTARILRKAQVGKMIKELSNGKEALDYLSKAKDDLRGNSDFPRPDLILLDLNMPLVNGWEFLEAFAQLPAAFRDQIVVVVLTTSLREQDRKEAEATGLVSTFLNKPLRGEDLNLLLEEHFA